MSFVTVTFVSGGNRMKHVYACVVASPLLMSCQSALSNGSPPVPISATPCASAASTQGVSDTIRLFFSALAIDDDAAVKRHTTGSFYAFEVGKRFTGPELSKLIVDAHKSGRIMQWNIGPVHAQVDCNIAFAAWENTGAAGTAGKLESRAWLESALLLRQGDRWVIAFLHSTPKDPRK